MGKKLLIFTATLFLSLNLNAKNIDTAECTNLGEDFIFAGGECIETRMFEGDSNEHLLIIVHGTWDEGTNTLGRYAPFAESMNMNTDLTTIAVALPGYSGSSTNNLPSLADKKVHTNQAGRKVYVEFLGELITVLKQKYEASKITLVGHSAGARMVATLTGLKPGLVQNVALAGGGYVVKAENKGKDLISFNDVIDSASKDTNYLFIYGTEDKISKPEVTTEFFKVAQEKGLKAKLVKVEGAAHIDLDMTDPSVEAITEMVEEE